MQAKTQAQALGGRGREKAGVGSTEQGGEG